MQAHERYMQRALELAARASGCTYPNPLVGCVIVKDGDIVGEGWHREAGGAHAEVDALSNAGDAAQGATLYVTLEPCNHTGRTPPCTHAIVKAGIRHVVFATTDTNPSAGGGAAYLAHQGIDITAGVLEDDALYLNRFFFHHVKTGQPFVVAKTATSLDGRIATHTGHSQWITGPEARQRGHELRQAVDAIMVGADTVIQDDPALTVRLDSLGKLTHHPQPVIFDSHGRVPLTQQLLNGSLPTTSLIVTTERTSHEHRIALESLGNRVLVLPSDNSGARPDPQSVLKLLGAEGVQSVLIEGGPSLQGAFLDAGLINEVWSFLAPMLIGGASAPAAFSANGAITLDKATRLERIRSEWLGQDLLLRAMVQPSTDKASHTQEAA